MFNFLVIIAWEIFKYLLSMNFKEIPLKATSFLGENSRKHGGIQDGGHIDDIIYCPERLTERNFSFSRTMFKTDLGRMKCRVC